MLASLLVRLDRRAQSALIVRVKLAGGRARPCRRVRVAELQLGSREARKQVRSLCRCETMRKQGLGVGSSGFLELTVPEVCVPKLASSVCSHAHCNIDLRSSKTGQQATRAREGKEGWSFVRLGSVRGCRG
jgi:hypothetical protein